MSSQSGCVGKFLPPALLQTSHQTEGITTHLIHGIHSSMVHEGPRAMVCQDVVLWQPVHHLENSSPQTMSQVLYSHVGFEEAGSPLRLPTDHEGDSPEPLCSNSDRFYDQVKHTAYTALRRDDYQSMLQTQPSQTPSQVRTNLANHPAPLCCCQSACRLVRLHWGLLWTIAATRPCKVDLQRLQPYSAAAWDLRTIATSLQNLPALWQRCIRHSLLGVNLPLSDPCL